MINGAMLSAVGFGILFFTGFGLIITNAPDNLLNSSAVGLIIVGMLGLGYVHGWVHGRI